ncbi:MAG: hypothetical protein ACKO14_11345 [Armatimonadota bacterium]
MPLVFAAIMPHGGEIIPELADDASVMAYTRSGMLNVGSAFSSANIDTVIVITPHGLIYEGSISVSCCTYASGLLDGPRGEQVRGKYLIDQEVANSLLQHPILPMLGLTSESEAVHFPLDWGSLIPLLFTAETADKSPQVVILAEDRSLPRRLLVEAGKHIAEVAEVSDKRIALIASCDLGHAHDPNGPYGYHEASSTHDARFFAVVKDNALENLLDWEESFLEDATVDAYWQALMLFGALTVVPMEASVYTYEAPTYFGMLTASYSRL